MVNLNQKKIIFLVLIIIMAGYGNTLFATPAKPVISWLPDTVTSSDVSIQWDMWLGENANNWTLFANSEQKCTAQLTVNESEAQSGACDITLLNGSYELMVEICNDSGCTQSDSKIISISNSDSTTVDNNEEDSSTPSENNALSKPTIAWLAPSIELTEESVSVDITWNMWWGSNGNHWSLLQNGESVYSATVSYQATNDAQTAMTQVSLNSIGDYTFQIELCNTLEGNDVCTLSDVVTINVLEVGDSSTDSDGMTTPDNEEEGLLGDYNQAYDNSTGKVVASYFVEWGIYGRDYHVANIPATNLTHVLYGFIAICGDNASAIASARTAIDSECADQVDDTVTIVDRYASLEKSYPGDVWDDPIRGNFGQLIKMKQQHPEIKILPSIGGWTLSDPFFDFANSPERCAIFVESAIEFIKQYDFFDGIDIDWEFPGGGGANNSKGSIEDAQGFADLMADLRIALDNLQIETGRTYELTAAMNVSEEKVNNVNYIDASTHVDYFFAMSYDFYGAWNNEVGHHSALYPTEDGANAGMNVSDGINNMINAGVPAEKIVVGAAMYGRGWTGVVDTQGNGAIEGTWEAGVLDYKDIEVNYLGGENGTGINNFVYQYDSIAEAPSLFNSSTGEYITYDNSRSVRAKGHFVINHHLAGLFSWEIDADNGHILNAMHQGLGHTRSDGVIDEIIE